MRRRNDHERRFERFNGRANPFARAVAIELLARETHTAIAAVQKVFLVEYKRLAEHAHITSYLPLLACSSVRGILESANARKET